MPKLDRNGLERIRSCIVLRLAWCRRVFEVTSNSSRSELQINSKWLWSDIGVNATWHVSDVEAKSNWILSGVVKNLRWHCPTTSNHLSTSVALWILWFGSGWNADRYCPCGHCCRSTCDFLQTAVWDASLWWHGPCCSLWHGACGIFWHGHQRLSWRFVLNSEEAFKNCRHVGWCVHGVEWQHVNSKSRQMSANKRQP